MSALRALFFLLLFANGVLYYWSQFILFAPEKEASGGMVVKGESGGIVLLSELGDSSATDNSSGPSVLSSEEGMPPLSPSQENASDIVQQANPAIADLCWYVGFSAAQRNSGSSLESVLVRFSGLGIKSELVDVTIESDPGFLVYLPPLASRQLAVEKLKHLLAEGHDAYVIEGGERANGLSLGFFQQNSHALALRDKFIASSYQAEIREFTPSRSDVKLRIASSESDKLSPRLWANLQSRWPALQRSKNYCNAIASTR